MLVKEGFQKDRGAMALPLIHSHAAEQQGAAEVVRTLRGIVATHEAALPHRGKSGTDLKKSRARKMRWISKQVGRQKGGGGRPDKRCLTCFAKKQTVAMYIV